MIKKNRLQNQSIKSILLNSLTASVGLFIFGVGVYLTIRANIGVSPWDVLEIGITKHLPISYGTVSICISLIVLLFDIMLREKIGFGLILDAFIVGKTVDLMNYLDVIPKSTKPYFSIPMILLGLVLEGYSQYIYMRAALGCGPRDTLIVGLKRKLYMFPIGAISVVELAIVTFIGWLLGGPVGIGTIICAFLTGPVMQLIFFGIHFKPEDVKHQTIIETVNVFRRKHNS